MAAYDIEKVKAYYTVQQNAQVSDSPQDNDGDDIYVLKAIDNSGKEYYEFLCIINGANDYEMSQAYRGKIKKKTLPNRQGTWWVWIEVPDKFKRGSTEQLAKKLGKRATDKQVKNEKLKGKNMENGNSQNRKNQENTSVDEYTGTELAGDISEDVLDIGGAILGKYLGIDITDDTPAPSTTTVQTMDEWSTTDIALIGGAVALGVGVIYLIARK
jgi:hypothetical protein